MPFKDGLRKLLTSKKVLLGIAIAPVTLSLFVSAQSSEWHWFQRSGAFVVGAGALLSSRRLVRLGVEGSYRFETVLDGGHAAPTDEEKAAEKQQKEDLSAMPLGIILLAVGSAIWAYGDLLGAVLWRGLTSACSGHT